MYLVLNSIFSVLSLTNSQARDRTFRRKVWRKWAKFQVIDITYKNINEIALVHWRDLWVPPHQFYFTQISFFLSYFSYIWNANKVIHNKSVLMKLKGNEFHENLFRLSFFQHFSTFFPAGSYSFSNFRKSGLTFREFSWYKVPFVSDLIDLLSDVSIVRPLSIKTGKWFESQLYRELLVVCNVVNGYHYCTTSFNKA